MNKIKVNCSWDLEINLEHEKQIELYVDSLPNTPPNNDIVKIIFLLEPPTFLDLSHSILKNQHLFNYVFTHNQFILDNCEKAILFELGMTWIKDYVFKEKEFSVSTLVGFKTISEGHFLRHDLWRQQDKITIPKRFFLSQHSQRLENINNNPTIGESKDLLFDSQFHITIESTKRDNFFTEKLIDTLITKTVPIYYGCPNIDKWFNVKGFFIVNSLEEIINISNNLNEKTYDSMKEYIEENYIKAQKFAEYKTVSNRLKEKILETLS